VQEVARARHRDILKSPYSYLVNMGDGQVRHVHANKMQKFHVRVHGCNVISDSDTDFGRVLLPESVCDSSLPSASVDKSKIAHLSVVQQQQLLQLLDRYACCFSDKPGLCSVAEHRIDVTADFVPKQMRRYHVPDILKPEVERQIKELLDRAMIVHSSSMMVSPLVCVAKKQGGVRLACDYRIRDYVMWSCDDVVTCTLAITRPSSSSSQPPVQHRALVVFSVAVRRVCELTDWLILSTWRYCVKYNIVSCTGSAVVELNVLL